MTTVAGTLTVDGLSSLLAKRGAKAKAGKAKKNAQKNASYLDGEAEIAARARQGDHEAFEMLVRAYEGIVYNIAYHMCYDSDEAFDLTQEVFLRLHENFRLFDPTRPFRPWFLRLATNTMINKRHRKRGTISLDIGEDSTMAANVPDMTAESAYEKALRTEMAEFVQKAIEKLPEHYRVIVTLRYLEGLAYEELAEVLDIPMGTVKVRLFRARDRLKELLMDYYADGETSPEDKSEH